MDDSLPPDKLLEEVKISLEQTLEILEKGGKVEPNLIQKKAEEACQAISSLPTEEAKNYQPKLQEMIEFFSEVSTKLIMQQVSIGDDISKVDQRSSARNAYKAAASLNTEPAEQNSD